LRCRRSELPESIVMPSKAVSYVRCMLFTHAQQPLYNAFPFELTPRLF
jgi:hypothetical protein